MQYKNLFVTVMALSVAPLTGRAQTDADLAAFWDFESGRTGNEVWAVPIHGTAASPNCYDIMGNTNNIHTKNLYFEREHGEPTLAVVNPVADGIPAYGGNSVLKSTVFQDQAGYLAWCHEFGVAGACSFYQANVRARVDPVVPSGSFTIQDGDEVWVGFAMYIPTDYVYETLNYGTVSIMEFQYRVDLPPGVSSKGGAFHMAIGNGNLHIESKYSPTSLPAEGEKTSDRVFPVEKGVWYSIIANVKYDLNNQGFAKVWIDGNVVLDASNISIGYAGMNQTVGDTHYAGKSGLDVMTNYHPIWWSDPAGSGYRASTISPEVEKLTLYFDSLRLSKVNEGSYAMVDPMQDFGVVSGAPAAPVGLSAVGGDGQVALAWTPVGGATSYIVKRAPVAGGEYTSIAHDVAGAAHADATAANGVAYRYVVVAVEGERISGNSVEAIATPTAQGNGGLLTNISVRAVAGAGNATLIVGVAVSDGDKTVLMRGVGPTLLDFDLTTAITDARLRLFETGNPVSLATNINWAGDAAVEAAAALLGAFALENASLDAAMLRTLQPGSYSLHLESGTGESGVALVELYDAEVGVAGQLANLSARIFVGSGEQVPSLGFVVVGDSTISLLVRGVGPTLNDFNVDGALADPQLKIFADGINTPIASNDNWAGDDMIIDAAAQVGAFDLIAAESEDAALLVSLDPGIYVVQLTGAENSIGVGLLELYRMP